MTNYNFYRSLHGRGLTTTTLAELTGSGRAHVTEVLNNKPGHGHFTRTKLAAFLTDDELQSLGWTKDGQRTAGDAGRTESGTVAGGHGLLQGERKCTIEPRRMDPLAALHRSTRNIVPTL